MRVYIASLFSIFYDTILSRVQKKFISPRACENGDL